MKWQYLDGVQSPNPAGRALPGGDAVQAVEVVHAEVASRVRDQPLVPQADQLGADHGASRADEFRQVLVGESHVDRMAVSAAMPLEADYVPEGGCHPGPDRRGELPEQPAIEELSTSGHRFEKLRWRARTGRAPRPLMQAHN